MSDKTEVYRGVGVTVRFDGQKCVHSRNCVLGDPRVFVPNAPGPWIHPDAASVERVVELVHACPSGALTYERTDGEESEQPPVVNTVRVRENGPLAFHAQLHFAGERSSAARDAVPLWGVEEQAVLRWQSFGGGLCGDW